jgi:hypothetical protein
MNLRTLIGLLLLGLWCQPAMSYIDPVNGAVLLQLLLSGIAGVGLVFRRAIGSFFRRLKLRSRPDSHE